MRSPQILEAPHSLRSLQHPGHQQGGHKLPHDQLLHLCFDHQEQAKRIGVGSQSQVVLGLPDGIGQVRERMGETGVREAAGCRLLRTAWPGMAGVVEVVGTAWAGREEVAGVAEVVGTAWTGGEEVAEAVQAGVAHAVGRPWFVALGAQGSAGTEPGLRGAA